MTCQLQRCLQNYDKLWIGYLVVRNTLCFGSTALYCSILHVSAKPIPKPKAANSVYIILHFTSTTSTKHFVFPPRERKNNSTHSQQISITIKQHGRWQRPSSDSVVLNHVCPNSSVVSHRLRCILDLGRMEVQHLAEILQARAGRRMILSVDSKCQPRGSKQVWPTNVFPCWLST